GVKSTTGASVEASPVFQTIKDAIANGTTLDDAQLEAIKSQAIAPLLPLAAAIGLPAENIAVAWTVTTQSAGPVLQTLQATVQPQESAFVPVPKDPTNPAAGVATTADLNPALQGKADVYIGAMEIPYYLSATDPLADFWNAPDGKFLNAVAGRLMPEQNGVLTVPVILTVPNSTSATGGAISGVVIFQHGITQNRLNALAVADALADTGHAVIAIDLPLHGLTDKTNGLFASSENPLYKALAQVNPELDVSVLTEATLNLDVDGDGAIDPSGTHFINLASLLTARDNVRQGVANLMALTATIPTIDYNIALDGGVSGTDFDGLDIHFVGHSLGAIVGTSFLAVNDTVTTATLAMPGGGLTQLFLNSPTFLPQINAGLAENGLVPGTQLYYNFFRNAQTVIGKGDPINYGATAAAAHPIHMIEVVGGASSPADQVIPNLSTDALANVMNLACIDATTGFPTGAGLVQFSAGDHGSILSPAASLQATVEMQTEMATFIGTSHVPVLPVPSVFGSTGPVFPRVIAPCPAP
ncbi:MAG TPA: hypothetical protein VFP95_01300, partial [Gammaproteobacteria bacterium]|nr:hypothetical protein [Gammaproteobacteria bacterium]